MLLKLHVQSLNACDLSILCTEALKETGDEFKKGATKIHDKKRWEHYKVQIMVFMLE